VRRPSVFGIVDALRSIHVPNRVQRLDDTVNAAIGRVQLEARPVESRSSGSPVAIGHYSKTQVGITLHLKIIQVEVGLSPIRDPFQEPETSSEEAEANGSKQLSIIHSSHLQRPTDASMLH